MNTTPEELRQLAAVLLGVADGKPWQWEHYGKWYNTNTKIDGVLDTLRRGFSVRLKPEPKYRPWTTEEVPVGAFTVMSKTSGEWCMLDQIHGRIVHVGQNWMNTEALFADYTLADGSPCGKAVEE